MKKPINILLFLSIITMFLFSCHAKRPGDDMEAFLKQMEEAELEDLASEQEYQEKMQKDYPSADELNTQGYEHYKKKEYNKAMEFFHKALREDESHSLAAYNLACVLSLLYGQEGRDISYNDVVRYISIATRFKGDLYQHIRKDTDLDNIRSSKEFKKFLLASDIKEMEILFKHFFMGYHQYYDNFMHYSDVHVLKGLRTDEGEGFIILNKDLAKSIYFEGGTIMFVCDVYYADNEQYENLIGKTREQNNSTFGHLDDQEIRKSLMILLYNNKAGTVVNTLELTGKDPKFISACNKAGTVNNSSFAIYVEESNYAGGSYTDLTVFVGTSDGDIKQSETITIEAEDLSGGDEPPIVYDNLREDKSTNDNIIMIDKRKNGILQDEIELVRY